MEGKCRKRAILLKRLRPQFCGSKSVSDSGPILLPGLFSFLVFSFLHPVCAQETPPGSATEGPLVKGPEDLAVIYVDQYFEPPLSLRLSEGGENRAEALAHFTVGRIYENQDRPNQAINSYLKVLELQPDLLSLARKCAYLLARSGQQEQARQLLESTLERNDDQAMPFVMLSEFLSTYHSNQQENKDRALTLAQDAVEQFPAEALAFEHLTKMYLVGNRSEEAAELLDASLETPRSDPEFWLKLGRLALKVWPVRPGVEGFEEEMERVNRFYEKAAERSVNNLEVSEGVADFYSSTRQYAKAEKIYQRVLQSRTDRLDLRKKLATVYKAQEKNAEYIQTLLDIIEINPADAQTHRSLAVAYREEGEFVKSVNHQRIALKIAKGSANDYLKVANSMKEAGMEPELIDFLEEAAYLFPERPEFHLMLTDIFASLERYKEAVEYFKSCEEIAKKNRPELLTEGFYFQYGATVERSGDIDRAAELFQKTIEMLGKKQPRPEDENARRFAALVYNYLGYMWIENDMNIERGGELIKTAVDLDPESGAIADSLGWWHFKMGQYEKAKEELLRAEKLLAAEGQDTDPVILDHIARAYFKLEEFEQAIDYMERAVEGDPENEEFISRLEQFRQKSTITPSE